MRPESKILALATYPESAAATRFRLVQMLPYLQVYGWESRFEPFVNDGFLKGFYRKGGRFKKARYLATSSIRRLALAATACDVNAVFIQREAGLVGPPYAEFILGSIRKLPIIFDFDDAIWDLNRSRSTHPVAASLLKDANKCWYTMRRAAGIIAGSRYLAQRAREVNPNVEVVPTVVSATDWVPLPARLSGEWNNRAPVRIGWVGTHTTADQLELVEPALRRLRTEGYDFELHVVGAGEGFRLDTVDLVSRPWRLDNEISEFQQIDIGLAPMHRDPVYQGKCGFKQIQYMAVGVPFVSSWVGGARDFVVDGENGLVAHTTQDWYRQVKALLDGRELRRKLSQNGRRLVESRYCIEVQGPRVAQFVDGTLRVAD